MRMMCRTVQNKDTGQIVWERFTTKGIPEQVHQLTSFGCHYMLNMLPRGIPMTQDVLTTYKRMTDMVRVRGIAIHLDFILQPKSGYNLQLILFQSPYNMQQLSDDYTEDRELDDNKPHPGNKFTKQGFYEPNGTLLTRFEKDENEQYSGVFHKGYGSLIGEQKKIFDNVSSHTIIKRMKINHPNTTVLMDQRINCVNRKTKPKTFGYNKLIPSNTTWKYPMVQYKGEYHKFDPDEQIPDRKMYFMVFACPMTGPPPDPGQDMHDVYVEPHKDEDELARLRDKGDSVLDLENLDAPIPRTFVREGSVVSDSFGPEAGPSTRPMETIEEDPDDDDDTGPMTRSKGKARSKSTQPPPSLDPPSLDNFMTGIPSDDIDNPTMITMVKALAFHKATSKYERDKERQAQDPKGDKPAGNVMVDQYGWSRQSTIMFRPTFRIWWAPMVYRKPVRTGRFYAKRRRTYFKRR